MESLYNGCPTEILINLKEDDYMSSNVKDKSIHTSLHIQKTMKNIENKENASFKFEIKGKCQYILDMSPSRVKNEYNEQTINSFPNSEQDIDGALNACPTAILVDIPSSSRRCPQQPSLLNYKRDSHQEEIVIKSKSINQDIKANEFDCFGEKKYRTTEEFDNPCCMTLKSESPPRVRLKTPSPKSMCRISKEASKIIYNLNSILLDEDSLLCEEILPVSINFDTLDLDGNSDEEISVPKTESSSEDRLSTNTKPSVSIQTEQEIINSEIGKAVSYSLSSGIQNGYNSSKSNLARSSSESFNSKIKDKDLNTSSITSEELQSPKTQSGSFDDSVFFVSTGETSSVFIENNLTSDEKENIQERKGGKVLLSKPVINGRDLQKNSLSEKISVPKTESSSDDRLSTNTKPSVSIQTEQEIINSEIGKTVSYSLSSGIQNSYNSSKSNLARSSSEPFNSKIKDKGLNTSSITSEELQSPKIQSGSFDNSEISVSPGETSSVFIENNLASDDEENIQERKGEKVLLSKPVINGRDLQKNSLSEKKVEKCALLRNISNVKSNVNSRYLPRTNKRTSISSLSYNSVLSKSKEQKIHQKQELKKTTSAESPRMAKVISRSNSSQYDYRRQSVYQTNSAKQKPPLVSKNKSSSSDVKHSVIQMKTPSRTYSIATSLQSTSEKKSTLTPFSKIQNKPIPRCVPQSAGSNRLSFSKSWQQSSMSNSKSFRNQNSTLTSATVQKPSFCGSYSSKLNKQVLNQSISFLPSQISRCSSLSTTSKNRFSSKLNLPSSLNPEQDKMLARALFPSMPRN